MFTWYNGWLYERRMGTLSINRDCNAWLSSQLNHDDFPIKKTMNKKLNIKMKTLNFTSTGWIWTGERKTAAVVGCDVSRRIRAEGPKCVITGKNELLWRSWRNRSKRRKTARDDDSWDHHRQINRQTNRPTDRPTGELTSPLFVLFHSKRPKNDAKQTAQLLCSRHHHKFWHTPTLRIASGQPKSLKSQARRRRRGSPELNIDCPSVSPSLGKTRTLIHSLHEQGWW